MLTARVFRSRLLIFSLILYPISAFDLGCDNSTSLHLNAIKAVLAVLARGLLAGPHFIVVINNDSIQSVSGF